MAISTSKLRESLNDMGKTIKNAVADVLQSTDFISRTIGMNNSYEDLMYIVQALGREPVSLLGKDFAFIYDHVRRNYEEGTTIRGSHYGVDTSSTGDDYSCAKFTFYKERPTIRFADPYTDPMNLLDRWMPDFKLNSTKANSNGFYYAESHDDATNNIDITDFEANTGTESGVRVNSIKSDEACDLIRKTNDYFKHGKYRTLVARFHTDSQDSKDFTDSTQTAISRQYGMSHGRNLLKEHHPGNPVNGYDNPYCRVWTYHHQYHTMEDAIRPFEDGAYDTAEKVRAEMGETSFRTLGSGGFGGGSERLDKHGVLNYENGFVNIAPKAKIVNYFNDKEDDKDEKSVSIKRCMFSIENLAWKGGHNNKGRGVNEFDPDGLSAEQKGPLGGRIMWFPPYDLKFSESSHAKWNSNEFIGRGENIYTYVNTERRGNLSFKLLIDHPSIIDYWEDRDNGSSYGGVDDIKSNEAKLLRFFAGCEILKAKPQTYWYKQPTNLPEEESDDTGDDSTDADKTGNTYQTLYCFVYFPNNYSGKDDGETVNPMHYLANGIGTQKEATGTGNEPQDFAVNISAKLVNSTGEEIGYGGYEMRSNKGISYATEVLAKNHDTIAKTFYNGTKQEMITDADGEYQNKFIGYEGGTIKSPAKQVYSGALTLDEANGEALTGKTRQWFMQRWYYRVDKDTEVHKLHLKDGEQKNYLDTTSNQYNSVGYKNIDDKIKKAVGYVDDADHKLVSFTDMFVALEDVNREIYKEGATKLYNEDNVALIQKIKEGKEFKFVDARFYGGASSQQNNDDEKLNKKRNKTLADNRMLTFKNWLNSVNFPCMDSHDDINGTIRIQEGGEKFDVNNSITKQWRFACVEIRYEAVKEETALQPQSETQEVTVDTGTDKERKVDANKVETLAFPTIRVETQPTPTFNGATRGTSINDLIFKDVVPPFMTSKDIMNYAAQDVGHQTPPLPLDADYLRNAAKNVNVAESVINKSNTEDLAILAAKADKLNKENEKKEEKDKTIGYDIKSGPVERYDNEGEFFKSLEQTDPFLHRLISEKIKYFDPAFHSISPEGFNARLTFLHQCTRQGATIGNSDANMLTAYNLAFGRPPVCVLRIGDFYYTKIIIDSVDIDYDDMQWDLNPEGIGVMPMMANIRLNFTFIGGSDLAGPISRLQNAVSFNYYANTGVYDNRAEMVEYASDKSGRETKFKGYVFPQTNPTQLPKKRTGTVEVGDIGIDGTNKKLTKEGVK